MKNMKILYYQLSNDFTFFQFLRSIVLSHIPSGDHVSDGERIGYDVICDDELVLEYTLEYQKSYDLETGRWWLSVLFTVYSFQDKQQEPFLVTPSTVSSVSKNQNDFVLEQNGNHFSKRKRLGVNGSSILPLVLVQMGVPTTLFLYIIIFTFGNPLSSCPHTTIRLTSGAVSLGSIQCGGKLNRSSDSSSWDGIHGSETCVKGH